MNGKWSTGVVGVTTIVALVVGFFIAKILTFAPTAPKVAAQTIKAVINRSSSDNSCQQYAGPDFGNVVNMPTRCSTEETRSYGMVKWTARART